MGGYDQGVSLFNNNCNVNTEQLGETSPIKRCILAIRTLE